MSSKRSRVVGGAGVLCLVGAVWLFGAGPARLPPIVFVTRASLGHLGAIPGLGPHHSASAPGGRLMLWRPDGTLAPLVDPERFHDVSDPAVSPSGTWIAFAATERPDHGWRIWRVRLDGTGLVVVTGSDRVPSAGDASLEAGDRYDDVDPCWLGDSLLCFASSRLPLRSQYADLPVFNLYLVRADGTDMRRITTERNGALEPRFEPRAGRIVYARWWFNAWRAATESPGVTRDPDRGIARDTINLWHLVAVAPDALGPHLAAGAPDPRLHAMAAEATPLSDGTWIATYASNLGLSPAPRATGLHRLDPKGRPSRRMIGALIPSAGADPYRDALGLAAPSACSPAALPDGRVVFAWDPGGGGNFGLWIARPDGSGRMKVVDLPDRLELDPAPVVTRSLRDPGWDGVVGFDRDADRALLAGRLDDPALGRFDFECEDVHASGGLPGAPARTAGQALKFFAALPRPGSSTGDTAVLVRTEPVGTDGAIRARGLPAGVPMFEQLVDERGAVVLTSRGPAHVPGLNAGAPGQATRCVGCHAGHSRLPVGSGTARRRQGSAR